MIELIKKCASIEPLADENQPIFRKKRCKIDVFRRDMQVFLPLFDYLPTDSSHSDTCDIQISDGRTASDNKHKTKMCRTALARHILYFIRP
ncbi:MAG: hypothetical protein K6E73_07605 [Bacteroidales bacterium]|nr:hypothetical protein [Bacteroidales bacterium]